MFSMQHLEPFLKVLRSNDLVFTRLRLMQVTSLRLSSPLLLNLKVFDFPRPLELGHSRLPLLKYSRRVKKTVGSGRPTFYTAPHQMQRQELVSFPSLKHPPSSGVGKEFSSTRSKHTFLQYIFLYMMCSPVKRPSCPS